MLLWLSLVSSVSLVRSPRGQSRVSCLVAMLVALGGGLVGLHCR